MECAIRILISPITGVSPGWSGQRTTFAETYVAGTSTDPSSSSVALGGWSDSRGRSCPNISASRSMRDLCIDRGIEAS